MQFRYIVPKEMYIYLFTKEIIFKPEHIDLSHYLNLFDVNRND